MQRRLFLRASACGLGSVAARALLAADPPITNPTFRHAASVDDSPVRTTVPAIVPKARRVIFLFMAGGPSHVDLFDPKPRLRELEGQPIPPELLKDHQQFALIRGTPLLKGSRYRFDRWGQSGQVLSELLPHLATVADELAIVRSLRTETNVHDPAVNVMNCGSTMFDRPTLGAWLSYGLGSENQDLPAYVVLTSGADDGQPLLQSFWGSGFLDSRHQGVPLRSQGEPVLYLRNPPHVSRDARRRELDLLRWMNARQFDQLHDPEILSRIESYEMAFRMQARLPELADLRDEPESVLRMYGAEQGAASFANNCLLARRLVERGVRFVQLYDRGWDSHTDIGREHARQCAASDRPTAALLRDLRQRGLLDDTLVVWGGEFGRTPVAQVSGATYGRDHHPHGFSMWLAGGGVKQGTTYGATDELGYHAAENPVHVRDLHATILHLLGLDADRLSVRVQGLDMRLTGVEPSRVVREILS
jgi:hypothetical protein